MAITRVWQTGAETGLNTEFPVFVGGAYAVVSTPNKTGTYVYRCYFNGNYAQYAFADTLQCRIGFYINTVDLVSVGTSNRIVTLLTSGDTELISIRVKGTSVNFPMDLYVASSQEDTEDYLHSSNAWVHVGLDVKIDSSVGWATVYINGIEKLSFSGDTGTGTIGIVRIGCSGGAGEPVFYDDLYIDDTTGEASSATVPMLNFQWIYPNETGNYDQWIGSDADNTNNYLLVDERPPSTADYVEEDTVDQFDSYAMTTYALGAGETINAVIPIVYAQRYGAAEELALGTRYSGTNTIGSNQDPGGGDWTFSWERQTTKPGGGAWDQAALDGVEVVIYSTGTF